MAFTFGQDVGINRFAPGFEAGYCFGRRIPGTTVSLYFIFLIDNLKTQNDFCLQLFKRIFTFLFFSFAQIFVILIAEQGSLLFAEFFVRQWITEIKHTSYKLIIACQNAKLNFQIRNAFTFFKQNVAFSCQSGFHPFLGRHPSVTVTEQADKKRSTSFNFIQANFQHVCFPFVFLGDGGSIYTPPQVNDFEFNAFFLEFFFHFRNDYMF